MILIVKITVIALAVAFLVTAVLLVADLVTGDRTPLSLNLSAIGATNIVVTVQSANGSETRAFPIHLCAKPDDWEFFDVAEALKARIGGWPEVKKSKSRDPEGRTAMRITAVAGAFVKHDYVGFRLGCDLERFKNTFGETGPGKTVVTVLPDTAERYFSTPLFEE